MSMLLSCVTLEELAQELGLSSAKQVLRKMLEAEIFPIMPLRRGWHVFVTPSSYREKSSFLKDTVVHRPDVVGVEVDKNICTQLIESSVDKAQLTSVYVACISSHKLGKESAAAGASSHLCRKNLPLIFAHDNHPHDLSMPKKSYINNPLFTVFDASHHPASEVQKWRFPENIQCSPGVVVKLNDLRLLPEDEAKLRQSLSQPKPAPKHLPTSGQHISAHFAQLLEVFNDHCEAIEKARDKATTSAQQEQLRQDLHKALQTKDPIRWKSATLRGYAIGLIFPALSDGRRSKKHASYTDDGTPRKLATLLEKLASQYEQVHSFETAQYREWLFKQLQVTEKEASNITTIVRLKPPRRGGRRLPVQASPEVQQPSLSH